MVRRGGGRGGRGGRWSNGGGRGRRDGEIAGPGGLPYVVQQVADATLRATDARRASALRRLNRADDETALYRDVYDDLMNAPSTEEEKPESVDSLVPCAMNPPLNRLQMVAALIQTGGCSGLEAGFDAKGFRNLSAGKKHKYYTFDQVNTTKSCKLIQNTFYTPFSTNIKTNKKIVQYAAKNNQLISIMQHFPLQANNIDTKSSIYRTQFKRLQQHYVA